MGVFSPVLVNNIFLPNHFSLAPINTGLFFKGHMRKEFIDFYRKRAGNYIGTTYVGNVAIDENTVTNPGTAYFSKENFSEWAELAEIISSQGSVPAIQLGCRFSRIPAMREWINCNPEEYISQVRNEIGMFAKEQIDLLIEKFLSAAQFAWQCGFKVLQVHAAHGYLLSLLCNPVFNSRDDEYNPNDLLFLKKLMSALSDRLPEAILDIRISFLYGVRDRNAEIKAGLELLDNLVRMPVHIISVSNGVYNINKNYIYPPATVSEEQYISFGNTLSRKYPDKYWSIAGNLHDIRKLTLGKGEKLLFSFGRQLICDPTFICKYVNHQEERIIQCTHCGKCHYYSRFESSL